MVFYSIDDQNGQVLAFKYFKKSVDDFFDRELDDINLVILNVKKFTKQLSLYESYNLPLQWVFECEDGTDLNSSTRMVRTLEVRNAKLRTFLVGGEPFIIRDLGISTIFDKVDHRYRRFGFEISLEDFNQIIELINLDPTNETVEILLTGKDIIFREKGWELEVGSIDLKESLLMKKKYWNNFKADSVILADVFENFIVLKGTDNDLLISLEHEN
jgi:hypothetical protein